MRKDGPPKRSGSILPQKALITLTYASAPIITEYTTKITHSVQLKLNENQNEIQFGHIWPDWRWIFCSVLFFSLLFPSVQINFILCINIVLFLRSHWVIERLHFWFFFLLCFCWDVVYRLCVTNRRRSQSNNNRNWTKNNSHKFDQLSIDSNETAFRWIPCFTYRISNRISIALALYFHSEIRWIFCLALLLTISDAVLVIFCWFFFFFKYLILFFEAKITFPLLCHHHWITPILHTNVSVSLHCKYWAIFRWYWKFVFTSNIRIMQMNNEQQHKRPTKEHFNFITIFLNKILREQRNKRQRQASETSAGLIVIFYKESSRDLILWRIICIYMGIGHWALGI